MKAQAIPLKNKTGSVVFANSIYFWNFYRSNQDEQKQISRAQELLINFEDELIHSYGPACMLYSLTSRTS